MNVMNTTVDDGQGERPEQMEDSWRLQQDQLDGLTDGKWSWKYGEDESMSFGEALTLLVAIGVLIYLIYALLLPERF